MIFAFAASFLIISTASQGWAGDPYAPPVGGVDTPINFMMTLAVPVLAILSIFGLLLIFGRSRIRTTIRQGQS